MILKKKKKGKGESVRAYSECVWQVDFIGQGNPNSFGLTHRKKKKKSAHIMLSEWIVEKPSGLCTGISSYTLAHTGSGALTRS